MIESNTPLIYPDIGFLTYLMKRPELANRIKSEGWKFAYSEATLFDLKNAKNQEHELTFLNDNDAVFLEFQHGRLVAVKLDAKKVFTRTDTLLPSIIGSIFSRLVGGGPDVSEHEFLETLLSHIPDLDAQSRKALITPERIKDSGLRKADFNKTFDKVEKLGEAEDLPAFIARQIPDVQDAFLQVLPKVMPSDHHQRAIAFLMLNFIMAKPAKGIRGTRPGAAQRETVDACHISYALGCEFFATHDKSTARKYKLLAKYWGTKGMVALSENGRFRLV